MPAGPEDDDLHLHLRRVGRLSVQPGTQTRNLLTRLPQDARERLFCPGLHLCTPTPTAALYLWARGAHASQPERQLRDLCRHLRPAAQARPS